MLCYLESKSHDRAAKELGCPKTTLERRLSRGRELLRKQLIRRGVTLSAAGLTAVLCEKSMAATVGVSLVIKTAQAAVGVAAGKGVAVGCLTARAVALAEEAMAGVSALSGKLVGMVVAIGVIVGGAGWAGYKSLAETSRLDPPAVSRDAKRSADSVPRRAVRVDQYGDALPEGAVARLGGLRFRHEGEATALAFTPDGKSLIGYTNSGIMIWDAASGKEQSRMHVELPTEGANLDLSPDGKTLAIIEGIEHSEHSKISIWQNG